MNKKYEIKNGDISDGDHTFDELYEHRCLLYIAWIIAEKNIVEPYLVRDHYPDWDLVWCHLPQIGQISYHIHNKYRELYKPHCVELLSNEGYDGHTSIDVIERIGRYLRNKI